VSLDARPHELGGGPPAEGAPRAGILVTGTELLSGRRGDRNGPWLSERLRAAGIDVVDIVIVGDERPEIVRALRHMAADGLDLVVTSGGLGPTADDVTVEAVAELHRTPMVLDAELERRIAAIVEPLRARFPRIDPSALAAGTRKQATVPTGAIVLEPVGTAPGLVLPRGEAPATVVLPGPPRELQPMWAAALDTAPMRALLARAGEPRESVLLLFGIPESEIAATLRAAEVAGIPIDRLEITTCLHRGEIEVATRYPSDAQSAYDQLERFIAERHEDTLFSRDGSTVDEQVAAALLDRRATVAVAESCTGGLLAARLTDLPGSSRYFRGGMVAYANEVKESAAGVDPALIEHHGAVSAEVARALARGASERLGADIGVGVTGVAGPGGGSAEKPVGLVWLSVVAAGEPPSELTRSVQLPGGRTDVRERATTVAMHMLRRLLLPGAQRRPPGGAEEPGARSPRAAAPATAGEAAGPGAGRLATGSTPARG
jgi:nicotinamide-nucleotide amidase